MFHFYPKYWDNTLPYLTLKLKQKQKKKKKNNISLHVDVFRIPGPSYSKYR